LYGGGVAKDGELLPEDRAFGANLRQVRLRRGLSQDRLAEMMSAEDIGFHQQTLTRIENGRQPVRLGEAMRLASLLDTTVEALLDPEVSGHEGDRIAGAVADFEQASDASIRAARRMARAHQALTDAVERAVKLGLEEALAAELAEARRALGLEKRS
jgi:transcriptional regulator with XRE-family HTH domain